MYKNVVGLYGVPRSGTSWLGQILDSCPETAFRFQPLFSYRFKNRITTESTQEEIEEYFKELYNEKNDDFLNQADKKRKGVYPSFFQKSSDPFALVFKEAKYLYTIPLFLQKCNDIKIISIIRNPYDVLESWINAPSEFNIEWNVEREWIFASSKNEYRPENYYGYNKWKEFIKMNVDMNNLYPQNFMTIRYEDMLDNALSVSQNIFSFLELPFSCQTKYFISESQTKTVDNPYSVYRKKGEVRPRKAYLSNEIKEKISEDLTKFQEAQVWGYL